MQDTLTGQIISSAIKVHCVLGLGLLESIYEEALCYELSLRNISFERQKVIDVIYTGKGIKGKHLDLLVYDKIVVELKLLRKLDDIFTTQVLSYLKSRGLKRGLLINFGESKLVNGIKRISL